MAIEVKIPIPDQTTEEVRIVCWKKSVGDTVKHGEIILEIETDKAVMEVESVGDGVLLQQLVQVDDMVPVGQVIGFIGPEGSKVPSASSDVASVSVETAQQDAPAGFKLKKTTVTPLARKIAEKKIRGQGVGRRRAEDRI